MACGRVQSAPLGTWVAGYGVREGSVGAFVRVDGPDGVDGRAHANEWAVLPTLGSTVTARVLAVDRFPVATPAAGNPAVP
jgi:hypothetical protein